MKWFVSRQIYWGVDPEDQHTVEIAAGGLEYSNPDMLVAKYDGEGEEYSDPREAVEAAINIAKSWKQDCPDLTINVAHGSTGGYTMPFEGSEDKELRAWAQKTYESLPKCDQCGELRKETWHISGDPDAGDFCSQYCAEKAEADIYEAQEELEGEYHDE